MRAMKKVAIAIQVPMISAISDSRSTAYEKRCSSSRAALTRIGKALVTSNTGTAAIVWKIRKDAPK